MAMGARESGDVGASDRPERHVDGLRRITAQVLRCRTHCDRDSRGPRSRSLRSVLRFHAGDRASRRGTRRGRWPRRDHERQVLRARRAKWHGGPAASRVANLFVLSEIAPLPATGYWLVAIGRCASAITELPNGISMNRSRVASSASAPVSAAFTGAAGIEISWFDSSCPAARWSSRTAATIGRMVALVYDIRRTTNPAFRNRSVRLVRL